MTTMLLLLLMMIAIIVQLIVLVIVVVVVLFVIYKNDLKMKICCALFILCLAHRCERPLWVRVCVCVCKSVSVWGLRATQSFKKQF